VQPRVQQSYWMATRTQIRSRNFCFTMNNPGDIRPEFSDKMNYLIYQLEEGETKTPHLQGYVQYKTTTAQSTVVKYFKGAHITIANGTPDQNKTYCTKEPRLDGPWEFGEITTQGKRTDLDGAIEIIRNSKRPLAEIMEQAPQVYVKYPQGMKDLCNYHVEKRTRSEFRIVKVIVHWGTTGTGKTRTAVESNPDHYIIRNEQTLWWDGYTGQSTLIIDEFKNWITLTQLLGLLDGYQCRLPVKGSFTYAQWDTVYITSNLSPDDWYPNIDPEHKQALNRRITEIKHFTLPILFSDNVLDPLSPDYKLLN